MAQDAVAQDGGDVAVRWDESRSQYVAALDGTDVGRLVVERDGDRAVFAHTLVDDAVEGRGVGSTLVAHALADAKDRGWTVEPRCPFVAAYLRKHPEAG